MVFLSTFVMMTIAFGTIADLGGSSSTQTASNVIPATTSSSIPQGGTAVLIPSVYASFVDSFNPFSASVYPEGITSLIYEPLFQVDPLNGTTLPFLGTGYNWTNNYLTLQVNLRQGVTFTNGEAFNASSVVFTFNLMRQYPALDPNNLWDNLNSVKAVNNYEVDFNLTAKDLPIFYFINLVLIVPQNIWSKVSNPVTYVDASPVGTGPFVLGNVSASEITLNANTHYWMPNEPHLSHIVYYAYTSNNGADLALEDGQVSWAGLFVPDLQSLYVNKDPSNYGYYYPYKPAQALYTNDLRWPLNESYVREAISMSINRTKLYEQGEYGFEQPATGVAMVANQVSSWLNATVLSAANNLTTYNITMAKAILSAHGYTMNSNGKLVAPNGTAVPSLTIEAPAGWTDWDADISLIATELSSIGLSVSVITPTYSTLYSNWQSGNYWLIMFTDLQWGPTPYYGFVGEYGNNGTITPNGQIASQDFERWNASEYGVNNLLNNFTSATSSAQQHKIVNEIAAIVVSQVPTIQTVYNAMWYEWNNATIGGFPTGTNNYWVGAPWQSPANEVVALNLYSKDTKVTTPVSTFPTYGYVIIGVVIAAIIAAVGVTVYTRSMKKRTR
ncbi:MAG: ABC transporter substrate-binding protein [Thermoplasmatales archaeon]